MAEQLFRSVPCRLAALASLIGMGAEQVLTLARTIRLQSQWADPSRRRLLLLIIEPTVRRARDAATSALIPLPAFSVACDSCKRCKTIPNSGQLHELHELQSIKTAFSLLRARENPGDVPPLSGCSSRPLSTPGASIAASSVCASSALRTMRAR